MTHHHWKKKAPSVLEINTNPNDKTRWWKNPKNPSLTIRLTSEQIKLSEKKMIMPITKIIREDKKKKKARSLTFMWVSNPGT